jgi:hypothetical protein
MELRVLGLKLVRISDVDRRMQQVLTNRLRELVSTRSLDHGQTASVNS